MKQAETHSINWNGQTLVITANPNAFLSRIEGEEITVLKVTSHATAKPLIDNTFAASLIAQAGGAVNFVDVMLSAEQYAA
ncbi:MAG: hypothetical protein PW788_06710 [Micavibrio sp.]|nr:hypothetical protein [Micavibrio sp.]